MTLRLDSFGAKTTARPESRFLSFSKIALSSQLTQLSVRLPVYQSTLFYDNNEKLCNAAIMLAV